MLIVVKQKELAKVKRQTYLAENINLSIFLMDDRIIQFVNGATNARISIISESASFQSEIAMPDRELDAAGFIRTNRPPSKTVARMYGTTKHSGCRFNLPQQMHQYLRREFLIYQNTLPHWEKS